jgi:hypothetical protein
MKRIAADCPLLIATLGFVFWNPLALATPEVKIHTYVLSGNLSEPLSFARNQVVGNTTLYAAEGTKIYAIATATDFGSVSRPLSIEITVMRGTQVLKHYGPAAHAIKKGVWVAPTDCKGNPGTCNLEMAELHSEGDPVTITAKASNSNGSSQIKMTYVVLRANLATDPDVIDMGGFAQLTWSSRNGTFAQLQQVGTSSRWFVSANGQTNVSPAAKTTFRLIVAATKDDFAIPCGATPRTACSEIQVSVTSAMAVPPAGKIWIQPIYLWDNSVLMLTRASAHFSGRYIQTDICPAQEPLNAELAFDATLGPLDVGPISMQNPARVPMTGSNVYLAEVKAGTMCIYATSPEVNRSRVCRKDWSVGISPEVLLNTIPPFAPNCG